VGSVRNAFFFFFFFFFFLSFLSSCFPHVCPEHGFANDHVAQENGANSDGSLQLCAMAL
jgi:hypothetical protein